MIGNSFNERRRIRLEHARRLDPDYLTAARELLIVVQDTDPSDWPLRADDHDHLFATVNDLKQQIDRAYARLVLSAPQEVSSAAQRLRKYAKESIDLQETIWLIEHSGDPGADASDLRALLHPARTRFNNARNDFALTFRNQFGLTSRRLLLRMRRVFYEGDSDVQKRAKRFGWFRRRATARTTRE